MRRIGILAGGTSAGYGVIRYQTRFTTNRTLLPTFNATKEKVLSE